MQLRKITAQFRGTRLLHAHVVDHSRVAWETNSAGLQAGALAFPVQVYRPATGTCSRGMHTVASGLGYEQVSVCTDGEYVGAELNPSLKLIH